MKTRVSLVTLLCSAHLLFAAEPIVLKLWPEGVPSPAKPVSEATKKLIAGYGKSPTRVSDVTDPEITVYRAEKPNGTSVVVAPGGGYMFLSYAHEGTQVCEWLNSLGVTAVLLKYRTPTRDEAPMYGPPVEDAQRAIGLVRHHATEWGLDPKRVGLLGFSAGGNILGHVACDRTPRTYPQKPDLDDPRGPDFGVMIYGGGFLDKDDRSKFMPGFTVPKDAPPMFFLVAHNDNSNSIEAAMLYLEYKKLNLPAELHVYTHGGHGFGMRKDKNPINEWPARCGEWLKAMGYLGGK
ncbi:MAG TPA: alpha/beta hydrolase [Roseimicrobium sp.]|nr:alpha/beta hydrolase [Roseimicrobium sp.]